MAINIHIIDSVDNSILGSKKLMTNTNTNTDEIGKQAEIIVDCGIDGAECAAITSLSQ